MAGRRAQQLIGTSTRDLKEVGGLAAGNEKSLSLISAAEGFAKKAAESGRNPPHPSARWNEIATMWQEAIKRLESIPANDVQGYAEAQRQLAEYRSNLSEVLVRLQNEQEAVQALDRANRNLADLWASLPKDGKELNRNQTMGRFLAIRTELDKVKSGTTVYLPAQEIKIQVQNQLRLLEQAK
jgi:tetratricopeptide (TPR) repeat protein